MDFAVFELYALGDLLKVVLGDVLVKEDMIYFLLEELRVCQL